MSNRRKLAVFETAALALDINISNVVEGGICYVNGKLN